MLAVTALWPVVAFAQTAQQCPTGPTTAGITAPVSIELAKLRWRIERDYQELKQELGLGHYEGGSRGFHHHATLAIAAYGFLLSERRRSPQDHAAKHRSKRLPCPEVSDPRFHPFALSGTSAMQSQPFK